MKIKSPLLLSNFQIIDFQFFYCAPHTNSPPTTTPSSQVEYSFEISILGLKIIILEALVLKLIGRCLIVIFFISDPSQNIHQIQILIHFLISGLMNTYNLRTCILINLQATMNALTDRETSIGFCFLRNP